MLSNPHLKSKIRNPMISIEVKLFALLRERAGVPGLNLDLPDGSTVAVAVAALLERLPVLRHDARFAAYAVNRAYAGPTTPLENGDELALIPPVSGGRGERGTHDG